MKSDSDKEWAAILIDSVNFLGIVLSQLRNKNFLNYKFEISKHMFQRHIYIDLPNSSGGATSFTCKTIKLISRFVKTRKYMANRYSNEKNRSSLAGKI